MTRSASATAVWLIAAVAFLVFAVFCFYGLLESEGFAWILRALGGGGSVVIGIILSVVAKDMVGTAPCPSCGAKLTGLEMKDEQRPETCEGCGVTVVGKGGVLEIMRDDHVAEGAIFEARIFGESIVWPEGCCVCGAPATRDLDVVASDTPHAANLAVSAGALALGRLAIRTGGGTVFTVKAPHCDAHENGAVLEADEEKGSKLKIAFRSAAYHRAFVALNPDPSRNAAA